MTFSFSTRSNEINETRFLIESLGNHEFDEAVGGLVPFVKNISSPVVAANLILDKVPELKNLKNLHNSVTLEKNDVKIGIIGYLTPETKFLAPQNIVEYEDEVPAIKREVKKLKDNGVSIIIALGHSGYIKDLEIARNVDDLDLVIGGHSNTFLWNGESRENPEKREGPYPVVVKQSTGRKVLVVQAYAYTKYMGRLHLTFDSKGDIEEYDGSPLLLDNSVPQDPKVLDIVEVYRSDVNKISNEVVGSSKVYLNGDCRRSECNMGNVITDIVLNYTRQEHFPYVNMVFIQSGRIRTSLERVEKPFNVTKGDWMTVLPFSDALTRVTMNGSVLRMALEHSVAAWRPIDSSGQFLQLSGVKVVYDLMKPPGARIVKALAVCSGCDDGQLSEIKDNVTYDVMMPQFLAKGGDGFSIFVDLPQEDVPFDELTCIYNYLKVYPVIETKLSDRITLLNADKVLSVYQYINGGMPSSSFSVLYNNNIYIMVILLSLISNIPKYAL